MLSHFGVIYLTWILLKTVISKLGNGRQYILEYITDTGAISRRGIPDQEEKSYSRSWSESEMKQIANCFLVSFFLQITS